MTESEKALSFIIILLTLGIIVLWRNWNIKCKHEYKYLKEVGFTYQQLKCTKCGKLKIVDQ